MSQPKRMQRQNAQNTMFPLQQLSSRRDQSELAVEHQHEAVLHSRSCLVGTANGPNWPYRRIIGQRAGQTQEGVEYLVEWSPTWEKGSNISDLQSAISEFNNQSRGHLASPEGPSGSNAAPQSGADTRVMCRTVDGGDLQVTITATIGRSKVAD